MKDLSALDVFYIVRELSTYEGAKVEKIMQSTDEKRDVLFTMYHPNTPKLRLRFILPGMVCLHDNKPPAYPKVPPGFAMFLRKYLGGARIAAVKQQGFDRVFTITFTRGTETMHLVIEMLAPGNMLLVLEDGTIKGLLETQNFKDRTLRGGIAYVPPASGTNPALLSQDELHELLATSTRNSIVTALAMDAGLGGLYAEEVCARAEIDKSRSDLTQEERSLVVTTIKQLLEQPIAPHKDAERAYPFDVVSKETKPLTGTFLGALGSFYESFSPEPVVKKKTKKDKLATMLKAQEKQIQKFQQQAEENQQKGELIYEKYQEVQDVLKAIEAARLEKRSIQEAVKEFPIVVRYFDNTGEVEVDI